MEAHRRDLPAGAHQRGPGAVGRARGGSDGAGAGRARRVRALLQGERAGGRGDRRRRDERDSRRRQRARVPRARRRALEPVDQGAQPRAGGALRLPGRRELDDACPRLRAGSRWRLDADRARRGSRGLRQRLVAPGHGAHDRALPGGQGDRPSAGAWRRCASTSPGNCRSRPGSPTTATVDRASSAWAARCETSPQRPSVRPACRPTACRGWSSRPLRWGAGSSASRCSRPPSARAFPASSRRAAI